MTADPSCPFCTLSPERIVLAHPLAWAIHDGFPVSPGHSLIIPGRHVASFFQLTEAEQQALLALARDMKAHLDARLAPAAYNLGLNDGPAAGQTVPHVHLHLIPRYMGDQPDPRGGVRWVLPEKACYWTESGAGPAVQGIGEA